MARCGIPGCESRPEKRLEFPATTRDPLDLCRPHLEAFWVAYLAALMVTNPFPPVVVDLPLAAREGAGG